MSLDGPLMTIEMEEQMMQVFHWIDSWVEWWVLEPKQSTANIELANMRICNRVPDNDQHHGYVIIYYSDQQKNECDQV
jgi:hypothetical protein